MKTAIVLLLALAPFVVRGQDTEPDTKAAAYVNVDGIVLGLVFDRTTFDAGNFVNAVMVVSNASQVTARLPFTIPGWDILDTGIGDYIVTDANGKVLPKVVWALSHWRHGVYIPAPMTHTHVDFPPGASMEYPGDIMRRYSLTNPGVYQVKAIARVPRPVERAETMVIETPPITFTVTPSMRPADDRDLYKPEELAMIPELTAFVASRPPLRVTHPKPDTTAVQAKPVPKVEPPPIREPTALKVQEPVAPEADAAPGPKIVAEATTSAPRNRGVIYGLIALALIIGLGVFLWFRRKAASS